MGNTLGDFEAQVLEHARRRAEQAEVFTVESVETPVAFEANRLKQLRSHRTRGVALRVIAGGKIGLASTSRLECPEDLVEDALAVSRYGAETSLELPGAALEHQLALYDATIDALSVEKMVELGQTMIDLVLGENSALLCEAGIEKLVMHVHIANSRGLDMRYKKTTFSAGLGVNWIRGTDMLDVWETHASARFEFDPDALAGEVLRKVRLAERTTRVPTAQLPVILSPKGMAGTLLNSLASGFNGKVVLQGASPVGDKLGQQVFSELLTLHDDGLLDYAPASLPFDDEGAPARRTTLICQGTVSSFLYDLYTASLAGTHTTGNAHRSLSSLPSPGSHTLWMEPGEATLVEMIGEIKEGLLVDQVMGAWAGNVLAGEFSGNVHLGYRIENGELVGRVKDTMIAGNVFQALSSIAGLGHELFWVGGALRLPYMYLPALGVASKA